MKLQRSLRVREELPLDNVELPPKPSTSLPDNRHNVKRVSKWAGKNKKKRK